MTLGARRALYVFRALHSALVARHDLQLRITFRQTIRNWQVIINVNGIVNSGSAHPQPEAVSDLGKP